MNIILVIVILFERENLMKKTIFLVFTILFTLGLFGCDWFATKDNGSDKTVPIYQGMEFSNELIGLDYPLNVPTRQNASSIDISDEFGIITYGDIYSFVNPEEDFYITVKLYNPDNYVILRFQLNGVVYQSYQFEDGSDSENLILKVNSGLLPGVIDYTLDEIKYIDDADGNAIKDVVIEGNQTISVGVTYPRIPTATLGSITTLSSQFNLSFTIIDTYSLLETSEYPIYLFVYDGLELESKTEVSIGLNNVTVESLTPSKDYQYLVAGVVNKLDGLGNKVTVLLSGTFKTLELYSFDQITLEKESISYSASKVTDEAGEFSKVELYDGDTLVNSSNSLSGLFDGLFSDHDYELRLTYVYQLDGSEITRVYSENVKTLDKIQFTFDLNITSTTESLNYEINISDPDHTGEIVSIDLYLEEELIASNDDLSTTSFENLLSNHTYTLVINIRLDMNISQGIDFVSEFFEIDTLAKQVPSVVVTNLVPGKDTISYDINVIDPDQVGQITSISLYQNETLIEELSDLDIRVFNNLILNTEYLLKIEYTYNLNDGNGDVKLNIEDRIMTLFFSGAGTVENPYWIEEPKDFNHIIYQDSAYFILVNDIDFTGFEIEPVDSFYGHLDGNGHTISNIDIIDDEVSSVSIFGLFIHNYGEISNLVIENANLHFVGYAKITAGILVGQNLGVIDDVSVIGTIYADTLSSYVLGGLVGENIDGGLISNVYAKIQINAIADGNSFAGGIAGFSLNSKISFSHSDIFINVESYSGSILDAGGIVGYSRGATYEHLYSNGIIDSLSNGSVSLGGIIGWMEVMWGEAVTLTDAYSNVDLSMKLGSLGGIVGGGNLYPDTSVIIKNTFSVGDMVSSNSETRIGHIVGSQWGDGNFIFINDYKLDSQVISANNLQVYPSDESQLGTYSCSVSNLIDIDWYTDALNWDDSSWNIYDIIFDIRALVELSQFQMTADSISFMIDPLSIGVSYQLVSIELYLGDILIHSLTTFETLEFDGLLSNNLYTLILNYSYQIESENEVLVKNIYEVKTLEKEVPTVSFTDFMTTYGTINFDFIISDPDELSLLSKIEIYDNNVLIYSLLDLNERTFSNLLSNHAYEIRVTLEYDLNDGEGKRETTYSSNCVSLIDLGYALSSAVAYGNYDDHYYALYQSILTFDEAKAMAESLGGHLVTITSAEEWSAILSFFNTYQDQAWTGGYQDELGNWYWVTGEEFIYTHWGPGEPSFLDETVMQFALRDGLWNDLPDYFTQNYFLVEFDGRILTTEEHTAPTGEITIVEVNQDSFIFDVAFTNEEIWTSIESIELYQSGTLIISLENLDTRIFSNLLSNMEYTLVIYATYDLNDGNGEVSIMINEIINTLSYTTPTVESYASVGTDTVEFTLSIHDPDIIGEIVSIDLYQDGNVISSLSDLNLRSFSGLSSDTIYQIKITYSYNKFDGLGTQYIVVFSQTTYVPENVYTVSEVFNQNLMDVYVYGYITDVSGNPGQLTWISISDGTRSIGFGMWGEVDTFSIGQTGIAYIYYDEVTLTTMSWEFSELPYTSAITTK